MYYTVYKVTNKVNGKVYIGCHKTNDLNNNYMGSGKYLKYSISKYGIENFTKEILFIFDNSDEMFAKEAELVTEEFIAEENTYNLKIGGEGGWDYNNSLEGQKLREFSYKKWIECGAMGFKEKFMNDEEFRSDHLKMLKEARVKGLIKIKELYPKGTFRDKTHSDETKKKISNKAKLRKGKLNSQFGTKWTHSLIEKRSMKINKEDPLPEGWLEGRKMKF